MKKILTSIVLAIAIFSCGGSSSSDNEMATFTYNSGEEGKSLDPALGTSNVTTQINTLLQEGLTKVGKNKTIEPGLAKSWDVSEDGKTWTFHLRDNLKWSNGDPLVAGDFKFAWLRALNPETASEYAYMLYYIKGAQEYNEGKGKAEDVAINVIDDKTLEVTLKNTIPYFESLVSFLTYMPINEKFATEKGADYGLEAENMLYSGPYKLVSWTHTSKMEFEKNEHYYNQEAIKVPRIVTKFIADINSAANAFKNGEFNLVKISTEQYEEFKDDDRLLKVPVATTWYMEYNTETNFLKNKKIRQAITMAIDKEDIIKNVFRNINSVSYTLTPKGLGEDPSGKEFVEAVGDVIPKYNPEGAKKLLAEGLKELGLSKAPEISIILNDSGANKKIGESLQELLRNNLGLTVNIELMQFKERLARMTSKNFDIVLAGWGADFRDPITFLDLWVTNGGNNHTSFSNAEYDKLIDIAKTTIDKQKRFDALKRAEEILADEMPIGVLFSKNELYILDKSYKGIVFPSLGADFILNYMEEVK
ncbi:peptide ABC transporter substrate-binding protein [Oceanivirga salmonicida]|uniref:peptide ABC transporter substrate-binding protein n=1 Tax=Oceanivirga salmonicida TaxID=1769291 RepID=UPI0012E1171F|nr:peptide ABC transporter substrate-binding protein [Oceanivirga salmonicida]